MSLEHLWAGWRSDYVSSVPSAADVGMLPVDNPGDADPENHPLDDPNHCIFCRIEASGEPSIDNGVVTRGETCFAVLNAYPYASGHLLVMPRRHVRSMAELTEAESTDLWNYVRDGVTALESAYRPEGINFGANLGRAAGAGIPRHLHLHVVPRWVGDTNFMTAVAGVRVLPETLADSWLRLSRAWPGLP